jgi:hypothetical protein
LVNRKRSKSHDIDFAPLEELFREEVFRFLLKKGNRSAHVRNRVTGASRSRASHDAAKPAQQSDGGIIGLSLKDLHPFPDMSRAEKISIGLRAFVLAVSVVLGGCQGYLNRRSLDLADIPSAKLCLGLGLVVAARATQAVQVGVGFTSAAHGGMMTWRGGTIGRREVTYSPTSLECGVAPVFYWRTAYDVHKRVVAQERFVVPGLIYVSKWDPLLIEPNEEKWHLALFDRKDVDTAYDRRLYDVGVSLHLFLFGFECDVDLFEIADFLLGIVGIDIAQDDVDATASEGGDPAAGGAPR